MCDNGANAIKVHKIFVYDEYNMYGTYAWFGLLCFALRLVCAWHGLVAFFALLCFPFHIQIFSSVVK